jgi:hypothetical protein
VPLVGLLLVSRRDAVKLVVVVAVRNINPISTPTGMNVTYDAVAYGIAYPTVVVPEIALAPH